MIARYGKAVSEGDRSSLTMRRLTDEDLCSGRSYARRGATNERRQEGGSGQPVGRGPIIRARPRAASLIRRTRRGGC